MIKRTTLLTLICAGVAAASAPCFADGTIQVSNRNLGSNSASDIYNVPIWVDENSDGIRQQNEGIGTIAASMGATATLAVFVQGESTPFATAQFRTDLNGAFLGAPSSQSAEVPNHAAGTRAPLTVKVWIGGTFETASTRASWNFLSEPLGGVTDAGELVFPPNLYPWGDPSGVGYAINSLVIPGPVTGADLMVRRTGTDGVISVATLLANDSDPAGGAVTFVTAAAFSTAGASVNVVGDSVIYHPNGAVLDSFKYTVRNSAGGFTAGRVDVAVNDPEGFLVFANRNIPKASSAGTYDAPAFVDANLDGVRDATESFGAFASTYYGQPAKLGLFLRDGSTPIAVAGFSTDVAQGAFLATPTSQVLTVPGIAPGASVALTVKAWIGSSFDSSPLKGSWDFTSRPLGGSILDGTTFAIPGVTGLGSENGLGLAIAPGPKPVVGNDEVTRRYRKDISIEVSTLLANDSDPEGGTLVFVGADTTSNAGASVTTSGNTITYHSTSGLADFFSYTVRSAHGVSAKGRVDVKVTAPEGEISLSNRGIPKADGSGAYDVPIWVDVNFNGAREANEGIGTFERNQFAQTATLAIFSTGSSDALATAEFATDSGGAFIPGTNEVIATIATTTPGQTVPLTIKVWTGANYDTAAFKRSWDITSAPLGGPRTGLEPIPTPGLTGWGNENGEGFMFALGEKPTLGPDLILRTSDQFGTTTFATLLSNDLDPSGASITLTGIDPVSAHGIPISVTGTSIVYGSTSGVDDSFNYTVRFFNGGVGTGHVDVVVDDPDGFIFLSNRLVRKSTGGAYNIPVWVDKNFNGRRDPGEGIGDFAQQQFGTNATLALFQRDGTKALATSKFASGHASAFLDSPVFQTVKVPGLRPGSTAPLTVKVWLGGSFDSAPIKGSWDFTSLPLGGGKAGSGVFDIPDITGLASETSADGLKIVPGVKPITYGRVLTRGVGQNVNALLSTLTANDSDPEGGALKFVSVDETSANGAVLTILGNTLYYIHSLTDSDAPDIFEYTVRNAKGGIAKGRVDVVVTDGSGVFKTRLEIESSTAGARITFRGVIGAHYAVQARDNFEGAWQDVGAATDIGFGLFEVNDPAAGPSRFYRVLAQP